MFTSRKLCHRKLRKHKYRLLAFFIVLVIIFLAYQKFYSSHNLNGSICEPIDVVYTWVNGTDPFFINNIVKFDPNYDVTRFDDKNELRYSLRSLEKYAPWIRHVYIITNGQIPYWLDLSNERVTVVPHELLTPYPNWLPTFSSSAIETFIHRIPNLSQRFLYLNDDIFLGDYLYPEDLYTDSEGVRVYQAWLVPDCAEDCPWTYIGDGSCDKHCNIANCQYDGGDCSLENNSNNNNEHLVNHSKEHKDLFELLKANTTTARVAAHSHTRKFPKRKKSPFNFSNLPRNSSFRDLLHYHRNLTYAQDFKQMVENYNKRQQEKIKPSVSAMKTSKASMNQSHGKRIKPKDIFSQSLIYTNMLLNRCYGFKARHVLAHVGFLLERTIIEAMQEKFAHEIFNTASHRFRSSNDIQFAFAYYSFLMEETRATSVREIFSEFDTDHSQTWSDREIRTLLARTFPLPLDVSTLHFFEEIINNCSRYYDSKETDQGIYTTLVYERYVDSNLPRITRDFVEKCLPLAQALEENFSSRFKYKFHINSKRSLNSNFMMLTSNITQVAEALDKIRKIPRKFNCINDNMEPGLDDNDLIRQLLEDFYLSFFPVRSQYELPLQYRNRFENWHDYQRWRRRKRAALVLGYGPLQDDPISTVICNPCWFKVSDFHEFYESVEEAQRQLSETFLVKIESQTKAKQRHHFLEDDLIPSSSLPSKRKPDDEFNEINDEVPFDMLMGVASDDRHKTVAKAAAIALGAEEDSHDVLTTHDFSNNSMEDVEVPNYEDEKFDSHDDDTFDGEAFMKNILISDNAKDTKPVKEETITESIQPIGIRVTRSSSKLQHNAHLTQKVFSSKTVKKGPGRPRKADIGSSKEVKDKKPPEESEAYRNKSLAIDREISKYMSLHCEICNGEVTNFAALKGHMRVEHNVKGYARCCNKKFLKRVLLLEHIRKHLNPDCYKCDECNRVFADRQSMRNHFLIKHQKDEDKTFTCHQCPKKFVRKYLLEQHKMFAHGDRTTTCKSCNKRFDTAAQLSTHTKEHCYGVMCDICAKVIRGTAAFQRHQLEHQGISFPKVQCDECGSWHKDKYTLNKHKKRHEQSKELHVCDICQKVSPSRPAMLSHKRFVHNPLRSFECNVCKKNFKKAIYLKEHMASHTGEVLYRCPHCPKTFNSNANMHSHRKKMHPQEFEETRKLRRENAHLPEPPMPSISSLSNVRKLPTETTTLLVMDSQQNKVTENIFVTSATGNV
uniref:LNR domain-containing protein n=1 Tax=Glossina pallidipes TaxID=7398 RepID=A0A1A9ZVK5_GLOPL